MQLEIPGVEASVDPSLEFFPTPQPLADAIVRTLREFVGEADCICEPSAGQGPYVRALRRTWPLANIHAIDIRDTSFDCRKAGANEFTMQDWTRTEGSYDLIVGNPPFSKAVEHIDHGMQRLRPAGSVRPPRPGILAFLLRLTFWETPERAELFARHPLRAFAPIMERPRFTKSGNDSIGCGLFIWMDGWKGRGEVLPSISGR